jgi:hypothetical protein
MTKKGVPKLKEGIRESVGKGLERASVRKDTSLD